MLHTLAAFLAVCSLSVLAGLSPQETQKPPAESAMRERERAAEPLYQAAVKAASKDLTGQAARTAALDAIEGALKAGACPTRTLTEDAFVPLHTVQRYRELMRDHARQWSISMRLAGVDGQPLHVSGVVRDANETPVSGALVYVYHTDSKGLYSESGMDESDPRLFGYMRTDVDGRYEFKTIRPGHYPDQNEPVEQHVHYEVTAPGFAQRITRLGFADDPFWRGRRVPAWAVSVTRDGQGVDNCAYDIVLEKPS